MLVINFDLVKEYYDAGYWTKAQVHKMVELNKITAADYETITGEVYVAA